MKLAQETPKRMEQNFKVRSWRYICIMSRQAEVRKMKIT
jgi:hypothetical protein